MITGKMDIEKKLSQIPNFWPSDLLCLASLALKMTASKIYKNVVETLVDRLFLALFYTWHFSWNNFLYANFSHTFFQTFKSTDLLKGQLISKQNCWAVTSPKKWTKLSTFSFQDPWNPLNKIAEFHQIILYRFCFCPL